MRKPALVPEAPARAVSRAARRAEERQAELTECLSEMNALLDKYDATLSITRIVTVQADGIERNTFQVNTVSRS